MPDPRPHDRTVCSRDGCTPLDVGVGVHPFGARVCAVRGEVDISSAPALEAAVRSALSGDRAVVVDLTLVDCVGSAGAHALARAVSAAPVDRFLALVARPLASRVLSLCGLTPALPCYRTLAEALLACQDSGDTGPWS
ncbi:STAS domain-containing protein [Pseudonocardia bannensis]|uniref:STAS domain-containing protein n=1 Tax=Pseudonocardia bannensis TaxID=630973 RepID=A0A848DDE6_9PSEU|nr:STAS domain-containing protein [Pseudonocardia bannensis]NMH90616.1 STAS domain-containing protein [Pseudonocardia bannensis]